jgi:hypothetical protein
MIGGSAEARLVSYLLGLVGEAGFHAYIRQIGRFSAVGMKNQKDRKTLARTRSCVASDRPLKESETGSLR